MTSIFPFKLHFSLKNVKKPKPPIWHDFISRDTSGSNNSGSEYEYVSTTNKSNRKKFGSFSKATQQQAVVMRHENDRKKERKSGLKIFDKNSSDRTSTIGKRSGGKIHNLYQNQMLRPIPEEIRSTRMTPSNSRGDLSTPSRHTSRNELNGIINNNNNLIKQEVTMRKKKTSKDLIRTQSVPTICDDAMSLTRTTLKRQEKELRRRTFDVADYMYDVEIRCRSWLSEVKIYEQSWSNSDLHIPWSTPIIDRHHNFGDDADKQSLRSSSSGRTLTGRQ